MGWEGGATTKCTAFIKQYAKVLEATKMLVTSLNDTNITQDVQCIYQLVQYIIHFSYKTCSITAMYTYT